MTGEAADGGFTRSRDNRDDPKMAAGPGVASAGPHDNNGASVSGATGGTRNEGRTPGCLRVYGVGSWINATPAVHTP
ncbi:hypothetical protein ACFYNY_16245 [Streptomyces sp. NPDC006530]|uniref:hypothetical protein n=1 Tax=Streptomyces sp. NPDC006530 TaxID=3364750 RepID=UPI0036C8BBE0